MIDIDLLDWFRRVVMNPPKLSKWEELRMELVLWTNPAKVPEYLERYNRYKEAE